MRIRMLANRGHGQVAEYLHTPLPSRWRGPRNWAAAYYLQQRTRGAPHHTAVRGLAFK